MIERLKEVLIEIQETAGHYHENEDLDVARGMEEAAEILKMEFYSELEEEYLPVGEHFRQSWGDSKHNEIMSEYDDYAG